MLLELLTFKILLPEPAITVIFSQSIRSTLLLPLRKSFAIPLLFLGVTVKFPEDADVSKILMFTPGN